MAHAPNSGIVPSTYALCLPRCKANRTYLARSFLIYPTLDKLAPTGHDYLGKEYALGSGFCKWPIKKGLAFFVVVVNPCSGYDCTDNQQPERF